MVYLGLTGNGLLAGITVSSGMGFILFGYDDGVMGGILTAPSFVDTFQLDSGMQGLVTAIFFVGCFLGSMSTAILGSRFGRRALAHVGTLFMCLGAILQSSSYHIAQLIVGRIVAGIGLGLIASNVAIWQSETAPAKARGMLVACSLSFLIVGQLLAYWMEYGVSGYTSSFSWRFPMAFQAFLSLLMSLLLVFMPESPRYLLIKDRVEEATEIFRCLNPKEDATVLAREVADIKQAILLETHSQKNWKDLLEKDDVNSRYRVILACLINFMQDFSGSTPISYYTTYIFENSVGFSRHMSLLMSGFLQIWFLIASFGTWFLIERAGRRMSFMVSAAAMAVIMAVMAAMTAIGTQTAGIVAAVMIFAYQACYTWGFMGGVWTYGPEILPLEYRSKGVGLANSTLWIFAFAVTMFIPSSITNIGWKTYIIFAVFNLSYVPIIYFFFPETSGLSLEMIDLTFMDSDKGPVKRAEELRRMVKNGHTVTLTHEVEEKIDVRGAVAQIEDSASTA
ncbi:general substrate transporter [Xylariales sp. PMI_506]|nr:general substrate transporter [Xylariales sp. PMI_506]